MTNTIHATLPHTKYLDAVHTDLLELERKYSSYLEQESVKADVECLRTWIEAYRNGDIEAAEYLGEHGTTLLENVKSKLHAASREFQRVDEESPNGCNFNGAKADWLNKAATTALHAEDQLAKAIGETPPAESTIVTK